MKKRKAKRIQPAKPIDLEMEKAITEREKVKELELLNLVAKVLVEMTLRDLNNDKNA